MTARARKYSTLLAATLIVCKAAAAQTAELVVQTGHQHEVRAVAFSPDGRQVLTAGVWNGCKLWDTLSGQELRTLAAPADDDTPSNVEAAFFHPDGRRVFTISGGTIKTWDAATGKLLNKFGNYGEFEIVALSPDGARFAVVHSSGATMAIVDSSSGAEILPLEHESHFVWERVDRLAFSPDGSIVAGGGPDNFVRLWDASTGKQIGEPLKESTRRITALAFSPDGKQLANAADDGKILLWNVRTRQVVRRIDAQVQTLAFSPDGLQLLGGDGSGLLRKWDVASGRETARAQAHVDRFNAGINGLVVNAPQGLIATASDDKTAKLWDLRTLQPVKTLSGTASPIGYVAISPTGGQLVTSTWNGAVRIWSLDALDSVRTVVESNGGVFDFSPDGRLLATSEQGIVLRDTTTLDVVKTIDPAPSSIGGAIFTPDGKRLVTDDERSQVKLWDVGKAGVIDTLFAQSIMDSAMGDNVSHVAYSPDGRRFVTITNNGKFAVWDAASKTKLFSLEGRVNATRAMYSPDGREIVASAYYKKELWFWDAATGKRITRTTIPSWVKINAGRYAVGTFGGVLVRAETDGAKVRLLDANSNKEIATLVGLSDDEWVVTTPDGRFDTNKPLDHIDGLAWILSDDTMTPRPLELFMRQYYEPRLLERVMRCTRDSTCSSELKPLPSIAGIIRVQPLVREVSW